ncbi:BTB/POZ and MATH domain-containing protein 2-like [Triticum aestivum]|uniref:BTB/POZ and MATH domain-containing protein 2-like n=1 Tax=Triticum aestivum TaxID=4565 RepID=UPI001D00377D|nr:BTB/POZ and MATH domain-containing protein 2-like [Triticum aestivum]
MSASFTGVSVVSGTGELCPCAELLTDTNADYGYHLLAVQDYTATKRATPTGQSINSRPFIVGDHEWYIRYFPNGDKPSCADFISLYLCRLIDDDDDDSDDEDETVEAKFSFSFIDQIEKHKPVYIPGTKTYSFSRSETSQGNDKFTRKDVLEQSRNMKCGGFNIRCDVIVCNTEVAATLPHDICQHFNNLLQTKVGADVMFDVSGETFAAHRCVLAARSTVFMAQLFGPMKEGTTTSSVIQIKDMDATIFSTLLSFIYTDSFREMEKDDMEEDEAQAVEEEDEMRLQWLQDLFAAADRYDLRRFKFICEKHWSEEVHVSSVGSTLALAEQHHCHGLKEACLRFIQAQSLSCLQRIMETNGWKYLIMTNPSVLNELITKLASNQRK